MNKRKNILLLLSVICVCVFLIKKNPRVIVFVDNEQQQQILEIVAKESRKHLSCPEGNIITVGTGGQLGNRIWQYMSLYSAYYIYKDLYNLYPFVPAEVRKPVESLFENVSVSHLEDLPSNCREGRKIVRIEGHGEFPINEIKGKNNVVIELFKFSSRYEYVAPVGIEKIRKELRFKKMHADKAKKRLEEIKGFFYKKDEDVTFVGMHYRGTDYIQHIRKYLHESFLGPPDYNYFNKAMTIFQKQYDKLIFILITVDDSWVNENTERFKKDVNLVINPFKRDVREDLTLLSHCNHSIITYGSYSSTAALFAGGTTYVYDLAIPLTIKGPVLALGLVSKLPNWHKLK